MRRSIVTAMAAILMAAFTAPAGAEKLGVSIYTGWMPWYYLNDTGIMERWAKKYGVEVDIVPAGYMPSIEAFVAGETDACVMTNMEALDLPAAGGIDCTALLVGDYSDDNDLVLTRGLKMSEVAGHTAYLVEGSVSSYLLARGLEMNGLAESDVTIVNTNEDDIGPAFVTNRSQMVMASWNPIVMNVLKDTMNASGVIRAFGSSQIPGEILDILVVRTDVLRRNPDFGKALVGAWYETMELMTSRGPEREDALEQMARSSGCSLADFKEQLDTTMMFWKPADGAAYTAGSEIKTSMDLVRRFCASHGLLGRDITDPDVVGIQYPDGTVQGNPENIKLRFSTEYMQMAADGRL